MNNLAATARYIDTRDVAKLVRKHIKTAFPGVKFSVRIDRYAGGSSVGVVWTDGPVEQSVRTFLHAFRGGRFNGQTDCAYSADSWYCPQHGARPAEAYGSDQADDNGPLASRCCAQAELVHFGATSMDTRRALSPEFTAELEARVCKRFGVDAYDPLAFVDGEWMSTWLYRESVQISR